MDEMQKEDEKASRGDVSEEIDEGETLSSKVE
jgi:hypothetical protein